MKEYTPAPWYIDGCVVRVHMVRRKRMHLIGIWNGQFASTGAMMKIRFLNDGCKGINRIVQLAWM
jgi:hypothetical protein